MKVSVCQHCSLRVWEGWHDRCPKCDGPTRKTQVLDVDKFNPVGGRQQ